MQEEHNKPIEEIPIITLFILFLVCPAAVSALSRTFGFARSLAIFVRVHS